MVNVSCSTKFHAFALAEQLEKNQMLKTLYSVYHERKNPLLSRLNKRHDPEVIPLSNIHTFPQLSPLFKFRKDHFANNNLFDRLVSKNLSRDNDYKAFIGWSGMSYQSLMEVKKNAKLAILERGSCHISFQFELLTEEYNSLGLTFRGDSRVEQKEIVEYELADFITVPSKFAKRSFLERGFPPNKIFVNNFGVSSFFFPKAPKNKKFTILYVGALTVQKGLIHLFKALHLLKWSLSDYEVWFIGQSSSELNQFITSYKRSNWIFFGHTAHHELADKISRCSVMVHPSIQEGLSMVIPQVMSCGVPVIATTNTGGEDIIENGVNGFIVPIRSPELIANRLQQLYEDQDALKKMQREALNHVAKYSSWDQYGSRYAEFIKSRIS